MCIYMHSYLPQIHGHVVLYVATYNMRMYRLVQETRILRDMCAGKHASLGKHISLWLVGH